MTDESPIILESGDDPSTSVDAAVIWLHGLGADGSDFVPIVQQLSLLASLRVRFVFPHAPVRPITINQGYRMRGWYDITSLDIANRDDEAGIAESARILDSLCDEQIGSGIAANRIIVAGFSQGGAIALYAGLRFPQQLGGIMALSTYLPMIERTADEVSDASRNIPIFMAHGLQDDIVAYPFGKGSCEHLKQLGYNIEWHDYAMGHSVCIDEIQAISRWLVGVFGQS